MYVKLRQDKLSLWLNTRENIGFENQSLPTLKIHPAKCYFLINN